MKSVLELQKIKLGEEIKSEAWDWSTLSVAC